MLALCHIWLCATFISWLEPLTVLKELSYQQGHNDQLLNARNAAQFLTFPSTQSF